MNLTDTIANAATAGRIYFHFIEADNNFSLKKLPVPVLKIIVNSRIPRA